MKRRRIVEGLSLLRWLFMCWLVGAAVIAPGINALAARTQFEHEDWGRYLAWCQDLLAGTNLEHLSDDPLYSIRYRAGGFLMTEAGYRDNKRTCRFNIEREWCRQGNCGGRP